MESKNQRVLSCVPAPRAQHRQKYLCVFLASLGAIQIASAALNLKAAEQSKLSHLRVVARVAGRSVTDRDVAIDLLLEHPELYRPGRGLDFPTNEFDQALQTLLMQLMVDEENKILASASVDRDELQGSLNTVRKHIKNWPAFMAEYDVKDAEVNQHLSQKIVVQKIIDSRVKVALSEVLSQDKAERQLRAQKAIQDWISQLRSRYKIQRMNEGSIRP